MSHLFLRWQVELFYFSTGWKLDAAADPAQSSGTFASPQSWAYDACFKWVMLTMCIAFNCSACLCVSEAGHQRNRRNASVLYIPMMHSSQTRSPASCLIPRLL